MARGGISASLVLAVLVCGCASQEEKGSQPEPGTGGDQAVAPPAELELARVGDKTITLGQLRDFYGEMPEYLQSDKSGIDKERNHLQTLIDMELLRLEAQERGVDRLPVFVRKMKQFRRERLVGFYQVRKIKVRITEQEVRDYFAGQGLARRIRFGQILAASEENARAALREIAAGQDFQEVAEKWSVHGETGRKGGDTGRYVSKLDVPPALRETLFALQAGEVSDLVDLGGGVGLFKALDEAEIELNRDMFEQIYRELFIERSMAEVTALADSLKGVFGLELDRQGLDTFLAAMRRGDSSGRDEVRGVVLYRYEGGAIAAGDLFDAADQFSGLTLDLRDRAAVLDFAERNLIPTALFEAAALREGLDQEAAVKQWLERKRDQELVVQLRVQVLDERIEITEAEMRRHYEENPDRYLRPEEIEVQEILVDTETEARDLLERVRQGEDMGELARQYSRRPLAQRDEEGRFRFKVVSRSPYGKMAMAAQGIPVGQLGGPAQVPEGYSLFKVLSRQREPASYEESAKRVRATVNWIKKQQVFEQFLEELRTKYADRVEIREENLRLALASR